MGGQQRASLRDIRNRTYESIHPVGEDYTLGRRKQDEEKALEQN